MYIKVDTLEYPLSEKQIRDLYPNISFPKPFKATGYEWVFPVPIPEYNSVLNRIEEDVPELTELGTWQQKWNVVALYETQEDIDAAIATSLETIKTEKLNQLASYRFEQETKGVTLSDDTPIKTDRESQAMITGAYTTILIDPEKIIDWKGENGWVQLDSTKVIELATVVSNHVQSCFSREKVLSGEITAAIDAETLEAIDITVGW